MELLRTLRMKKVKVSKARLILKLICKEKKTHNRDNSFHVKKIHLLGIKFKHGEIYIVSIKITTKKVNFNINFLIQIFGNPAYRSPPWPGCSELWRAGGTGT